MEFTIRINAQELLLVGNALSDRPYKDVSALMDKIQGQINEQEAVAAATASTQPEPPAEVRSEAESELAADLDVAA